MRDDRAISVPSRSSSHSVFVVQGWRLVDIAGRSAAPRRWSASWCAPVATPARPVRPRQRARCRWGPDQKRLHESHREMKIERPHCDGWVTDAASRTSRPLRVPRSGNEPTPNRLIFGGCRTSQRPRASSSDRACRPRSHALASVHPLVAKGSDPGQPIVHPLDQPRWASMASSISASRRALDAPTIRALRARSTASSDRARCDLRQGEAEQLLELTDVGHPLQLGRQVTPLPRAEWSAGFTRPNSSQ